MKKKQFITIGLNPCLDVSCYVDELTYDDVIRIKKKKITPGGKAINVAKFLLGYGQQVIPFGISGGYNGIKFKKLLVSEKFPVDYLIETDAETRENYNFFLKTVQY